MPRQGGTGQPVASTVPTPGALALDGTTQPYAARVGTTALFDRADITYVRA